MSTGTLIFLLLTVGAVVWMFSMRRGGHTHGGMGGGGCCGGHGHGTNQDDDPSRDASYEPEQKPLVGPRGTQSTALASAPASSRGHRGC